MWVKYQVNGRVSDLQLRDCFQSSASNVEQVADLLFLHLTQYCTLSVCEMSSSLPNGLWGEAIVD